MSSIKATRHSGLARPQRARAPRLGRRDALRSALWAIGLRAIGLSTTIVFATPELAAAATPGPGAAAEFVRTTADRMIGIIDGHEDSATKRARLQTVVDDSVDTQQIARFCLGRYWRRATPAQRQRFVQLFHQVLLDGVTGQISGYRGVRIDLGRATVQGETTTVQSTVHRPDQAAVSVDWVVASTAAGMRIRDVVAEGVSMRLTRRSDYVSYLERNGSKIGSLIAAMQTELKRS